MKCDVCGNESYSIGIKDLPEFIRKEFTCLKCGRIIKVENWDRRYL